MYAFMYVGMCPFSFFSGILFWEFFNSALNYFTIFPRFGILCQKNLATLAP
jgi:hypothetical protein